MMKERERERGRERERERETETETETETKTETERNRWSSDRWVEWTSDAIITYCEAIGKPQLLSTPALP